MGEFALLVLISLFGLGLSISTEEQCGRCQELVHIIGTFCSNKDCSQEKFNEFINNNCERLHTQVDRDLCFQDAKLVPTVWNLIGKGKSSIDVCKSVKLCPIKASVIDYLKNKNYRKFVEYKIKHSKKYASIDEDSRRANNFYMNLDRIERLNKLAKDLKVTTQFGVNDFADLSHYEFKLRILSKHVAVADSTVPVVESVQVGAIPDSFDWRAKGAVTPVKNQGQCGSCWSFSTTGNIEGQWFLSGHTLVGLSEQNLVDCDHECMMYENQQSCDAGCDGGLMPNAFTYVIKNGGIDTESSYPYQAVDGTCSFNKANIGAKISNYTMISRNETTMAEYLYAHGPVSIAADAEEWQFYIGGVFDLPCGKTLDHGILIVGYGIETDILGFHIPFWWVKNSWGASWGLSGYLKIKRGDCKCGLCEFACSSIV